MDEYIYCEQFAMKFYFSKYCLLRAVHVLNFKSRKFYICDPSCEKVPPCGFCEIIYDVILNLMITELISKY